MSSQLINNFLKSKYDKNGGIPKQLYQKYPTLDRVPKRTDGGGDYFTTATVTGKPMGRGPTLAIAQASAGQGALGDTKGSKWIVPWAPDSGVVYIEDFDIKRSRSDEVTFLNWLKEQVELEQDSVLERTSIQLFAEPGSYLTVGVYETTGDTVTCSTASDISKIEPGMLLQAATSAESGIVGSGSIGYVISVNKDSGVFTVSATAGSSTHGTPTSWSNGATYYFIEDGMYTPTANVTMYGLGSWIPATAPGATAFCNVVRNTGNTTALGGHRLISTDVVGMSIRQRVTRLITIMNSRGTTPGVTDFIMNPEKWQAFVDELQAQGWRPLDGGTQKLNSNAIEVAIGGKNISIVSDRHCQFGWGWALTMPPDGKNIIMPSIDEMWHVINEDGIVMLRGASANTYEQRLQSYKNLVVKAPGWCGRVAL
jgi:hypothetical protein